MKCKCRLNFLPFTLIELLIVVAIISILTAMLLPALSSARSFVKRTVCAGAMRQIYSSAFLYTTDYNGWLPPTNTRDYMYGICGYLGIKNEAPPAFLGTCLQRKATSMMVCPTAQNPLTSPCWDGSAPAAYFRTNYSPTLSSTNNVTAGGWKIYSSDWSSTSDCRRIDSIKDGSAILGEQNYLTSTWSSGVYYSALSLCYPAGSNSALNDVRRHAFNHTGSANYLFKDGHVTAHPFTGRQFLDINLMPVN